MKLSKFFRKILSVGGSASIKGIEKGLEYSKKMSDMLYDTMGPHGYKVKGYYDMGDYLVLYTEGGYSVEVSKDIIDEETLMTSTVYYDPTIDKIYIV